jgi:PAS domain S-box-containing protein
MEICSGQLGVLSDCPQAQIALLQAVLDALDDAIVVRHSDGRIAFQNRAARLPEVAAIDSPFITAKRLQLRMQHGSSGWSVQAQPEVYNRPGAGAVTALAATVAAAGGSVDELESEPSAAAGAQQPVTPVPAVVTAASPGPVPGAGAGAGTAEGCSDLHLLVRSTVSHRSSVVSCLLEALPQSAFTATAQGNLAYENRKTLELTGARSEELAGLGWLNKVHAEDRDRVAAAWRAAISLGRNLREEFRMQSSVGGYRWVLAAASPVVNDDGVRVKVSERVCWAEV